MRTAIEDQHGGKLDILVNNAGVAFHGDTFGADEAHATLDVNLWGTQRVTEALLPALRATHGAVIT